MATAVEHEPPPEHEPPAAEAEPEPEEELEPEPEPEPEPEEEPEGAARSERDIEQALDKIGRENERHAKRLAEIMGDDFTGMVLCPRCEPFTHGWLFPLAPVPPEVVAATLQSVGIEPEPALRQDPDSEACEKCGGWGDLLTGARAERSKIKACPDCGGTGWRNKPVQPAALGHPLSPAPLTPQPFQPEGAPPRPEPYYDYSTGTWKLP